MITRDQKLTEKQVALWIRLQDLVLELHGYSFNMRFQNLKCFFGELMAITEDTKRVDGRTFNTLIKKMGYLMGEIIYGIQKDKIHLGPNRIGYPRCVSKIFSEIYEYNIQECKS